MKTLAEIISNPATRREQVSSTMCFINDAKEYIPFFDLEGSNISMYLLSISYMAFLNDLQGYHAKVLRKQLKSGSPLSIPEDALPFTHEELYES